MFPEGKHAARSLSIFEEGLFHGDLNGSRKGISVGINACVIYFCRSGKI